MALCSSVHCINNCVSTVNLMLYMLIAITAGFTAQFTEIAGMITGIDSILFFPVFVGIAVYGMIKVKGA